MNDLLQIRARLSAVAILLLLGGWVVQGFLPLLAWAVVLAISTWPIYNRLLASKELHGKVTWGAVALTLFIGAIILAPLSYGLVKLFAEAEALGQWLMEAQKTGIPPPDWLEAMPMIGTSAKEFWVKSLGSKEAANSTLHWLSTSGALGYTKVFAGQLMQRLVSFLIILLVLLFVYQHGDTLSRQVLASSRRIFGDIGVRYLLHAAAAVRGTVNGMMLIGIVKGLLLGVGYHLAGLGHPAILGTLTGIFAMIPFAAKLIFGACSLVLAAESHFTAAVVLFSYGMVLTLIADNYVRPVLIGNAVKLPFIWTLLGIFGGMEAFGLLGLFLGPTLMAVLMSIWRDWIEDIGKSA
ncbi:AI-2E family transporter [Methylovulum miyakonense]|uniref:AI-2E family transporter n=1 Tax=Methylovulum miyakonense TaxID=645578 RepID=UPI0003674952|nr:AI-2E family transporter [Methylovulum miyakonense]